MDTMTVAAPPSSPRPAWKPSARTPAQERFYRDLVKIDQLPTAPELAQHMVASASDPDVDLHDLCDMIGRDLAVAAKLLRLCNSAAFSFARPVTSIQDAVLLMGFARVRDIVLGLSVFGALEDGDRASAERRKALWTHSVTVATAARLLAERTRRDASAAFTVGLLHDIGKLLLGMRLGQSYWEMIDEAARSGEPATAVETAAFGCDHAIVGGWLLEIWRLPAPLVQAVTLYHEPQSLEYGFDLTSILGIADRLVLESQAGEERSENLASLTSGLLAADDCAELLSRLKADQDQLAVAFTG